MLPRIAVHCVFVMVLVFNSKYVWAEKINEKLFPSLNYVYDLDQMELQGRSLQILNKPKGIDMKLVNFIKSNISSKTNMPYSFSIHPEKRMEIYEKMGESHFANDVIERTIVEEGLIVYDGAVGQIVLAMIGGEDNLKQAQHPVNVYWSGELNNLWNIRAGYPINQFIYDPKNPELVSSDLKRKGERGFIFRIINANGEYVNSDPLDGKTHLEGFPTQERIHWEDWKPVAGENAWVAMAALHLYHKKYYDELLEQYEYVEDSVELKLAKELARAALILQTETGGVRMAPIGTYRNPKDFVDPDMLQGHWWYNQISAENNISWYAAMRMLYQITQEEKYKVSMKGIEKFFKDVWDAEKGYFHQGMNYVKGHWILSTDHFALDVQTWGLIAFGPQMIDEWLGIGASFNLWKRSKELSGAYDQYGKFIGVGYIEEHDRVSVEWTAGAIMAARIVGEYYEDENFEWSQLAVMDADSMRSGIESLRQPLSDTKEAYSYSSRRGWIPFGWNSHDPEVVSLASTGWVLFVDSNFNPFELPNSLDLKKDQLVYREKR
ncbi:hypothetical protein MNBD_UNCLBAC01-219 [hydrothermal vent metagenome]|uniref:Uncharacterized protein n=1 Tax=hydrothermal vent metagenome TaxID=652676 RepID=A0A3B1D2P0_9ZZZZ